ncbi:MAG: helix-turn-helix transcriptional regulator, partial [Acutalibacteraceae bacterium]
VEEEESVLSCGDLVFVRDRDRHMLSPFSENEEYQLHNLSISKEVFTLLMGYLGDSFDFSELFAASAPTVVKLSPADNEYVTRKMQYLGANVNRGSETVNRIGKKFLFRLMTHYFYRDRTETLQFDGTPPQWFSDMCTLMDIEKNWRQGIPRMIEISGKSRSHLIHSMKKYLGTTPTDFINERRLQCAERLLRISDLPVADIYMISGFENESWFYKKFKERYGETPDKYRSSHS